MPPYLSQSFAAIVFWKKISMVMMSLILAWRDNFSRWIVSMFGVDQWGVDPPLVVSCVA
jgi:hypothetical protein